MRSMKTSGCLTHGRSLKTSVLNRSIKGTQVASTINNQIEKFANTFNYGAE